MKLILIILFGLFASCKVTRVVKCECKQVVVDSTFLPATTLLPYGGGVPMPFEGHRIFPIWQEPLPDYYKPDTTYILSSVDTMLPVIWLGDTSIIRSHSSLRPEILYYYISADTINGNNIFNLTDSVMPFKPVRKLKSKYIKRKK